MTPDRTLEFFDAYAQDFNMIYGNENTFLNQLINKYFRRSMRVRYEKVINGCEPIKGKSVVDIGCGPGHYGIPLAKMGASSIVGIDFSKTMIDIAKDNANYFGVVEQCKFILVDFTACNFEDTFDYAVVMGVMDYIENPRLLIEKVLSIAKSKVFFSFPTDGGILAWQRKVRYKKKCSLYLYRLSELQRLFEDLAYYSIEFEKISRDYFATISMTKTTD